jgi:hypothetical protein
MVDLLICEFVSCGKQKENAQQLYRTAARCEPPRRSDERETNPQSKKQGMEVGNVLLRVEDAPLRGAYRAAHVDAALLAPALTLAIVATLAAGTLWFAMIERPFLRAARRVLEPAH